MLGRIIRGDLTRNRATSLALVLLMATATALLAAGAGTVVTVTGALDRLFERAQVPHVLQMHAGDLDVAAIQRWAATQPGIAATQVLPTHPLPPDALTIGGHPQLDSVLEPAATAQSPHFDLLLGMDNQPLAVGRGEVAVPLAYREQVSPGGRVTVRAGGDTHEFTVVSYLRDAQMNPTMVTSKRLLFHPDDVALIAADTPAEHLIEFRLAEGATSGEVLAAYTAAGLPAQGPAIDDGSIKLLAGISSTLVVAVLALVAVLVAAVGALTVRLALRTAVAADLPQLGVLKAVGVPHRQIRAGYLAKYFLVAGVGAALGACVAPLLHGPLTSTALLEMGAPDSVWPQVLAWVASALVVALAAISYSWWLLRGLRRVTTLDALRSGTAARRPLAWRWTLARTRLSALGWMGLRGATIPGQFGLVAVFALMALMTLLPAQVATSMTSPGFVTNLGVPSTQYLVETREAGTAASLDTGLGSDPDVARVGAFAEVRARLATAEGWEQLPVRLGDHAGFHEAYSAGVAPVTPEQVAISARVAQEQGLGVGQALMLADGAAERSLTVTGIYQDITNGGRTAQGAWTPAEGSIVGWSYAVDLVPGADAAATLTRWSATHGGASIAEVGQASLQMLGPVVGILGGMSWAALALAVALGLGLSALFGNLVLASEPATWAALRGLGVSDPQLRRQFTVRYLVLLALGLLVGVGVAAAASQLVIARLAGALLGAPELTITGVPWVMLAALPLALAAAVTLGVRISSAGLRGLTVRTITEE